MGVFNSNLHGKIHGLDDAGLLALIKAALEKLSKNESNKMTDETVMLAVDIIESGLINDFVDVLTNNIHFEADLVKVLSNKMKNRVQELENKTTTERVIYTPDSIAYHGNKPLE